MKKRDRRTFLALAWILLVVCAVGCKTNVTPPAGPVCTEVCFEPVFFSDCDCSQSVDLYLDDPPTQSVFHEWTDTQCMRIPAFLSPGDQLTIRVAGDLACLGLGWGECGFAYLSETSVFGRFRVTENEECGITFPDANLEAAVRETIGQPEAEICGSHLMCGSGFSAIGFSISDLTGIANFSQALYLRLNENRITDLGPLAGMAQLEGLYLDQNQISDLGPLAGLTQLERLHLDSNQITDLGPLAGLVHLENLHLDNNQVSDLTPLAGLSTPNSIELRLDSNQISDLTPLAGVESLALLHVEDNQISDLTALSGLDRLHSLFLDDNQIVEIGALAGLHALNRIYLRNNQIRDIGPLVDNPGLVAWDSVRLENNPLNETSCTVDIPALRARGVSVWHTCP